MTALNCFKDEDNLKFIGNNADTNADIIKKRIITYCNENDCEYFVNLKNKDFHHLL
ncbi:hypothetical protein [Propionispira raffinosivorans]|uniref:hypothetical protein n=1 Tax=Propionispira raffinosivorans TaxID=86959 RepID=UPI00037F5D94|nr:hypothetical protein [Propionispira raffinosivorans]